MDIQETIDTFLGYHMIIIICCISYSDLFEKWQLACKNKYRSNRFLKDFDLVYKC